MKEIIKAGLLWLKTWLTVPARLILSEKLFNRYYRDQHLYYRNPLYKNNKYQYRLCGCGSKIKVRWCCGKGKWISFKEYQIFRDGLKLWESRE